MSSSPVSSPRSSSPPTPEDMHTPTQNTPFLAQQQQHPSHPDSAASSSGIPLPRPHRSPSTGAFVSSPLNPTSPTSPTSPTPNATPFSRSRPASRGSMNALNVGRIPSDDSQAFSSAHLSNPFSSFNSASRASMVLYRLADPSHNAQSPSSAASIGGNDALQPPRFSHAARDSVYSTSGDSFMSISADSKYPSGMPGSLGYGTQRGLIPYAYDPTDDAMDPADDEDMLHDPENKAFLKSRGASGLPWRGILNISALVLLITALMILFIFYPVITSVRNSKKLLAIDGNIRVNGTGQVPVLFQMPEMVDPVTPDAAKHRTGFDGESYDLVFSDEFETEGRSFYPGDDPFWEAVDLWYGVTSDLEWYDPGQVTTKGDMQPGLGADAAAVPDPSINHGLRYKSGMLQSWNKFCFTSGYIEVAVILPGPDANTQGYWPGVWTMGNLGRPGYPATTDGTWPYSYNTCDIGTFKNQTLKDRSGPPSALHSDASRTKYNEELSWLPGQRVSACTCQNEDHPGPNPSTGRGAPEIDVLEAEKSKVDQIVGQVVSQSAQFAPFSHDYVYNADNEDEWKIWDNTVTVPNTYKGSAIQQAVSALTQTPTDMFQGQPNGGTYRTLGFEYWADPNKPDDGFITWQVDGKPSVKMGAGAVSADTQTQVGQRLIPVEPMAIILNLGISSNWQTIDTTTMTFPGKMYIDYVRVYQRSGQQNTNCSPKNFPTEDYINNHLDAYMNYTIPSWTAKYPWPKNSQFDGC